MGVCAAGGLINCLQQGVLAGGAAHYCCAEIAAPRATPLLARRQHQWAKRKGCHRLPDPSRPATRRRVHRSLAASKTYISTRQTSALPLRASPAERERERERERLLRETPTDRQRRTGRDRHTTRTHTHTHTQHRLLTRSPLTPHTPRHHSIPLLHALTRLARVVRPLHAAFRTRGLHPSRVPADARTPHAEHPTLTVAALQRNPSLLAARQGNYPLAMLRAGTAGHQDSRLGGS